jgi:hypothetical protein
MVEINRRECGQSVITKQYMNHNAPPMHSQGPSGFALSDLKEREQPDLKVGLLVLVSHSD